MKNKQLLNDLRKSQNFLEIFWDLFLTLKSYEIDFSNSKLWWNGVYQLNATHARKNGTIYEQKAENVYILLELS